MQVVITTAYSPKVSAVPEFQEHALRDRFRLHQVTSDAGNADIILFVDVRAEQNDWRMQTIQNHALVRQFREKAFVYCEMDQPYCGMPGLYTSMPRGHFEPKRQRACGYHKIEGMESIAASDGRLSTPTYLFSFMGRRLQGIRDAVLRLRHPRALVEDTSGFNFFEASTKALSDQRLRYREVLFASKFVLCPAGAGPASIRMFESMAAGRVPVIISDDWVPVNGPDWNRCSLRIQQRDIVHLPKILEAKEAKWADLASAARQTWDEWFAPDVIFHRMVEACLEIRRQRRVPEYLSQLLPTRRYVRLWVRHKKAALLARNG